MAIRVTQDATENVQLGSPKNRITQDAVETVVQPPGTQRLRVTQIAIEFPFPGPSVTPPPVVPPPTQGDTPPAQCQPPPGAQCTTEPDLRSTPETCELKGS